MRILIAEDDTVSRLMLKATLQKWGHDAVVTENGKEALAVLEQESPPELAILDWMMPEMDGLEVCRRIRQRITTCPVYIILLTAKTQSEDLVAGLAAGADDYVTKPFNRHELHARLQAGIRIIDLQRTLAGQVKNLEFAITRLSHLQQAQKLEAVGQLASGIAHEINTPMQYVGDNIRFLKESWAEIHSSLESAAADPDIAYLALEIPKAINDSLEGVQRVARIVRAMRDFCHPSGEGQVRVDLNRAIETTVTVSTGEWKYVADIETDLDPALPEPLCLPGEIQQVLLNLIVNAAHAIADVVGSSGRKGVIRIATSRVDDEVEIRISDTGAGIRPEHRQKVFEPFFTTKDVGKGTGQGLAIAYSVVEQQHKGRIWFESEVSKGTTFFVRLPMDGIEAKQNERKEESLIR